MSEKARAAAAENCSIEYRNALVANMRIPSGHLDIRGWVVTQAHPNCVAILLTGYPGFETAVQAIEDEVAGYHVKPADINSLVSTIERKHRTRRSRTQT